MIYLDNCASTYMREEVLDTLYKSLKEDFANPSSLHSLGFQTEKKLEAARELVSSFLSVDKNEIFFTSGGTESNNIAIYSAIKKLKNRGKHLITSKIEHPSVLSLYENLETEGYEVSYIGVDKDGIIDIDQLKRELRDDTILVSIMQVNNEIGSIQPIGEVSRLLRSRKTIFHVDGVQAFGKLVTSPKADNIDIYTFSSHKIHGPKGVGGMYIDSNLSLDPVIYGGKQERGFRSGTENTPAILAFAKAVELMRNNYEDEIEKIKDLNKHFRKLMKSKIQDIKFNTVYSKSSPYIVNVSINNIRGEVLVHYLEQKEIYISTSSACSSNDTKQSHVLKAIGLNKAEIEGSIRICFAYGIGLSDIELAVDEIKNAVEEIREIMG